MIGPYPQVKEDIEFLQSKGIKAVLNLQTNADMRLRGVEWEELLGFYKNNQIAIMNYPIADHISDLSNKIIVAAKLLDNMITQFKV